jgi:hypothetical protein
MATFQLPIVPFDVPTHVTLRLPPGKREDGMRGPVVIALKDLPEETLAALIDEFVNAVLEAARPPT